MNEELIPQYSDIIFYSSPEGNIHVEVLFNDETFWLSQKRMAELFGVEVHTVNYHLKFQNCAEQAALGNHRENRSPHYCRKG